MQRFRNSIGAGKLEAVFGLRIECRHSISTSYRAGVRAGRSLGELSGCTDPGSRSIARGAGGDELFPVPLYRGD